MRDFTDHFDLPAYMDDFIYPEGTSTAQGSKFGVAKSVLRQVITESSGVNWGFASYQNPNPTFGAAQQDPATGHGDLRSLSLPATRKATRCRTAEWNGSTSPIRLIRARRACPGARRSPTSSRASRSPSPGDSTVIRTSSRASSSSSATRSRIPTTARTRASWPTRSTPTRPRRRETRRRRGFPTRPTSRRRATSAGPSARIRACPSGRRSTAIPTRGSSCTATPARRGARSGCGSWPATTATSRSSSASRNGSFPRRPRPRRRRSPTRRRRRRP